MERIQALNLVRKEPLILGLMPGALSASVSALTKKPFRSVKVSGTLTLLTGTEATGCLRRSILRDGHIMFFICSQLQA